jgi:hypothetical protein
MKRSAKRYWIISTLGIPVSLILMFILFRISRGAGVSEIGWFSSVTSYLSYWLLLLSPALINAFVAYEKGRSIILWVVIGCFASIIGTIVLLVYPYTKERKLEIDDSVIGALRGVHYKIGGSSAYSGDLIITPDVIYYFPRIDVLSFWQKFIAELTGGTMGKLGGRQGMFGRELAKSAAPQFGSYKFERYSEMPREMLQEKLDVYVEEVKKQRGKEARRDFSGLLPPPIRLARPEIQNLSLTKWGSLSCHVPFDMHEFKVKVWERNRLHKALKAQAYDV